MTKSSYKFEINRLYDIELLIRCICCMVCGGL